MLCGRSSPEPWLSRSRSWWVPWPDCRPRWRGSGQSPCGESPSPSPPPTGDQRGCPCRPVCSSDRHSCRKVSSSPVRRVERCRWSRSSRYCALIGWTLVLCWRQGLCHNNTSDKLLMHRKDLLLAPSSHKDTAKGKKWPPMCLYGVSNIWSRTLSLSTGVLHSACPFWNLTMFSFPMATKLRPVLFRR